MSNCESIYMGFCPKDPESELDYRWDWTDWLSADSDEIVSYSLESSDPDFVIGANSNTAQYVTVWLSGGKVGTRPTVTCRITTAAGRTDDRTAKFSIKQR